LINLGFLGSGGGPARQQQSASSLSLGERLCAVFFPFVAIAEAIFFTLTDCVADLCPGSDSSASRRYGAGPSSSSVTFAAANKKRSHHHFGPFLRRGGWTSLDLGQLAHLADESRCCIILSLPPLSHGWLVRPPFFSQCSFDLTPSCPH
jgi:hypothetical protein